MGCSVEMRLWGGLRLSGLQTMLASHMAAGNKRLHDIDTPEWSCLHFLGNLVSMKFYPWSWSAVRANPEGPGHTWQLRVWGCPGISVTCSAQILKHMFNMDAISYKILDSQLLWNKKNLWTLCSHFHLATNIQIYLWALDVLPWTLSLQTKGQYSAGAQTTASGQLHAFESSSASTWWPWRSGLMSLSLTVLIHKLRVELFNTFLLSIY